MAIARSDSRLTKFPRVVEPIEVRSLCGQFDRKFSVKLEAYLALGFLSIMTPPITSATPNMHVTGIRAALLGGMCAIGVSCFFGSAFAGVWLRLAMASGATLQQAYQALMADPHSVGYWFAALVPQAFAGLVGGYIAARGGAKPVVYALFSSLVYLSFVGVMYINPSSQVAPFGELLISLVLPILSAVVGGLLYARKV